MRANRTTKRNMKDLDLTVFMSLMVILIPVLLAAAEFTKIAIIDVDISGGGSSPWGSPTKQFSEEKLKLTTMVTESAITILSNNAVLPSIVYEEVKGGKFDEITMIALDDNGKRQMGWYTKDNKLLTQKNGTPISSLSLGDSAYIGGDVRMLMVAKEMNNYEHREIAAIDLVCANLFAIHHRYQHAPDINDLIIASKDSVIYDKLIQMVDAAKTTGFSNISFAKVRS